MAFIRKTGSMLGRSVSNHINQDISFSKPSIFQALRWMSSSKLFVGGLAYGTDDSSLREAFNKYGEVADARVIVDRETGKSRGFGFVTYSSVEEASAAVQALDQQDLHGRRIRVDYANDRTRGYGGGGYRDGNFGGGYNSGGFGGNYGAGSGYNNNDGYGGGSNYNYNSGASGPNASNNGYDGGNLSNGGYNNNESGYGGSSNYTYNSGVNSYGNATGLNASNNGYDHQNFGIPGGAAGGDTYFSGGAGGSSANSGYVEDKSNDEARVDEGFGEGGYVEGNYADRRN